MLLTVLCQLSPLLQHYMQKQNYSPPYIKRHVQLLNFIIVRAPILDWDTFEDIIRWFENESYTERYLKDVKMVLFNIEFFHEHGCFPGNGTIKRELLYQTPSLGSLDMIYLQEHLDELISYMNEHDYSESCIRRLKFVANRIIVLSRTIEWNSYQEILTWYSSQNHEYFYMKGIRGVLGILEAFHNRNEMPTNRGTQNTLCPVFSNYSILNPNFRYLVDLSIELSLKRGLKASTINSLKAVTLNGSIEIGTNISVYKEGSGSSAKIKSSTTSKNLERAEIAVLRLERELTSVQKAKARTLQTLDEVRRANGKDDDFWIEDFISAIEADESEVYDEEEPEEE